MKKMTDEAFYLFGMIFLALIIWSYFTQNSDFFYSSRIYVLILFVATILGKYLLSKTRQKTSHTSRETALKESIDNGLIVFGMIFLTMTIISFFTQNSTLIYEGRFFLILFLLANITGRYFSNRKKMKTS
ncbi:hypothetical protein [Listeria grandensis]|uniref:hypothetical protein n=1 Tax=Listeria grandensis TaxID=1494963 RepID=UPI00164E711E|nr:hypothetical protein [Listeria grandensis]MBC6315733.1 hypothetical protein [Listeria grandensis]